MSISNIHNSLVIFRPDLPRVNFSVTLTVDNRRITAEQRILDHKKCTTIRPWKGPGDPRLTASEVVLQWERKDFAYVTTWRVEKIFPAIELYDTLRIWYRHEGAEDAHTLQNWFARRYLKANSTRIPPKKFILFRWDPESIHKLYDNQANLEKYF
jgi:hypothetical protein